MRVVCSEHPRYLAKRKPTSKCMACNQMWEWINRPAAGAHPGGYTTLFAYDDRSAIRAVPERKETSSKLTIDIDAKKLENCKIITVP